MPPDSEGATATAWEDELALPLPAGAESVRRCWFNLVFSPPPGTAEPGRPARPALRPFEPLSLGFGVCARAFEVGLVGLELFCDGRVGRRPACGDALRAS